MTDEQIVRAAVRAVGGGSRQQADLDDMVQDARVAVWLAHEAYDGRGTFGRYAFVKAKFAIIDGLRMRLGRPHRRPEVARSLDAEVETSDGLTLTDMLPSPAPGPERVVCARETVGEVAAWLATASPARAAAVRACDEGATMLDVVADRGVTLSAVCLNRKRGRAALREAVAA